MNHYSFKYFFRQKNVSVMQLHLVFFLMDIPDHKLIWLLLQKIKLITSEHMMLSVIRVTELENMDSSLVPHLWFTKRYFFPRSRLWFPAQGNFETIIFGETPNKQIFIRLKSLLKSLKKLLKRWNHNKNIHILWRKYPLWMISCNRKIFMNLLLCSL